MQPGYIKWLEKHKLIIEIALALLVVVSFFIELPEKKEIVMLSMFSLAGFYFIGAIFFEKFEWSINPISMKVFDLGAAFLIPGLVFIVLNLPLGMPYSMIGSVCIIIAGVILVVKRSIKMYYVLTRVFILAVLTTLVFKGIV